MPFFWPRSKTTRVFSKIFQILAYGIATHPSHRHESVEVALRWTGPRCPGRDGGLSFFPAREGEFLGSLVQLYIRVTRGKNVLGDHKLNIQFAFLPPPIWAAFGIFCQNMKFLKTGSKA